MSDDDKNGFVAGIYRNLEKLVPILGRIADALDADKKPEVKAAEPMEQMLLGLAQDDTRHDAPDGHYWTMPPAGEVAKAALDKPKPREWCNTVKVYEAIWKHFGAKFKAFNLADLCRDEHFLSAVSVATKNRVSPASLSKLLSVMRRSMAIYLDEKGFYGKGYYRCNEPTDELREAVEQMAKKRAAAKEASA